MAKGYSIRKTINYSRKPSGEWRSHSMSILDPNNPRKTLLFATIEEAEAEARRRMALITDPDEEGFWQYARIYQGKELIKTIER